MAKTIDEIKPLLDRLCVRGYQVKDIIIRAGVEMELSSDEVQEIISKARDDYGKAIELLGGPASVVGDTSKFVLVDDKLKVLCHEYD